MSVDGLADFLNKQLTHELATEAWAAQLKDSNFEDEQVREELEPILHEPENFTTLFNEVGDLADKIPGDNPWKRLSELKVDVDRVNALLWVFVDKALAKNSNARDVEYGFAASCCWMKLAGLKGSSIYKFFNQYLYKKILSVFRLIYRLKMYGSRTVTTMKKKPTKGKKGAKNSAPMMEDPEDEDNNALDFNGNELDEMLEKACDAYFSLIKNTALSHCPDQAKESVDLIRDLIRLDITRDTQTTPILSQRDMKTCDLISDRAFGLAHQLCESRHSSGGDIVHTRIIMPRLLFFSWEGDVISSSIPVSLTVARDKAIAFLKNRIDNLTDNDELETIAKLVSNLMARCPDRAEYRQKVAQSALALLALLPKKVAQAQLQLVYTFGLTTKTGLRALAVEMIPTVLRTMDLDQDVEEEDKEKDKSKREKKGSDEEEEEDEDEGEKDKGKKNGEKGSDEDEEDDEMNGTKRKVKKDKRKKGDGSEEDEDGEMNRSKRKVKKEKKGKKRGSDDEEDEEEMNNTRRKKKNRSDGEEDEEEDDANTTKRKAQRERRKKKKGEDDDEDEEEDEGNTMRRRRAAKDESMMRMKKQKKRKEEDSEEEEESEGEKEKKKGKKKRAEQDKLKKAQLSAPVSLRPSLLMLLVRGCLDKAGNLRARSLQQLSHMVIDGREDEEEGKTRNELKEAADAMVREHPRIIVQAMTNVDDDKEEVEEEDEERKARAAKLAELAAAELQIKNGVMYVVKSRMEDDVAAVRKAAIAAMQTLFFEWPMDNEEAEEMTIALKLRCLDNSQMVRRQAMETISFLLEESIDKGHRAILETTWLRAVLPLINDREEAVQKEAAKLIEDTLISPIMRADTPPSCWHMLKRVEEEVSNRRLLVRTLAYLSTKETRTLKETVVDTLNRKFTKDPAHSNVIWMLLADLSTVFGDKIDPRTAVRTWYDLPENDTSNTMSYVAKVVGEGAKKLKGKELDEIAEDIEGKLLEYRVHGPHISTVYLALARLMDAVGELASGMEVLESFGSRLLEKGSKIIYDDLQMFTEMEEDKQEVSKEDEIRVIRIVITIGEVIQLSPNLIDSAQKLFDGLKLIMSSELYLSDAFQQRRMMNSVVDSRAPSAMGHQPDSQGHGQSMIHSETGNMQSETGHMQSETGNVNQGSQQTVIPSQIHKEAKNLSLRKALFTPPVRRCALTTIGKFCLMDEKIAQKCIHVFSRQLKRNPDHIIRNNIVVVLCDLCIRFTSLVDKHTAIIASCLTDRAILVRQQTLECLTILIKESFIRWEGQLMYRFVATILDECRPIREYAIFCLTDVLLPQHPSMFYDHFIECLLYFNDVPRKYKNPKGDVGQGMVKFSLSGSENEPSRIKLYEFMLATFDDKQKFITMAKMCEEIFSSVYSGEMNIEEEKVVALLTDAFKVISCEQMQLKLDVGKRGDEDEEEAPQAVQEAAKSMITAVFRSAIITSIMPHVLELRRYLIEKRHPTLKYMLGVLRALTRSHMDQLKEFFAGDQIALREIEYDIKRLNNLEEKLKLKAAQEAQMEAERARIGRRQTIMEGGGMRERDEAEKEVPAHPNRMEMMEVIEIEEEMHPETRAETSTANGNGEDVDVEMDEPVAMQMENGNGDVIIEMEGEKEGEEEEVMEEGEEEEVMKEGGEKEGEEEEMEEGGEMEVEETHGENGAGGEMREKEKEKESTTGVEDGGEVEEIEEEEEEEENVKENEEDGEIKKKSAAERGEAEIKEEPVEDEGEKENQMRRNRRKGEMDTHNGKEMEMVEVKEEPLDEEEGRENHQFVVPSIIGKKRSRAASETAWMNESAMVGGYGQSTPRKATPGEEDEEEIEGAPRLDLDISAIAPPPVQLTKTKSRISRKPKTGTIEE